MSSLEDSYAHNLNKQGLKLVRDRTPPDHQAALHCFYKAAAEKYPPALNNIGVMTSLGLGMGKDPRAGVAWYRQAAELDEPTGQYNLGAVLVMEHSTFKEGLRWLHKASRGGNVEATVMLGKMHATGDRVRKNHRVAARFFRQGADSGDPHALFMIGLFHQEGWGGVPRDTLRAIEHYRKAADKSHAEAAYELGRIFESGLGEVPRDILRAIEHYRKAADKSHAEAAYELGRIFESGLGEVPRDVLRAIERYQEAADKSHAEAAFRLGRIFESGLGEVPRNVLRAVHYYRLASDSGPIEALLRLGLIYRNGREAVARNISEAVRFFQIAADRGNDQALYYIGEIHASGEGVEQNENLANDNFRRAAILGHPEAQLRFGLACLGEEGVTQNFQEAIKYLEAAFENGIIRAATELAMLLSSKIPGLDRDVERAYVFATVAAAHNDEEAKILREAIVRELSLEQVTRCQSFATKIHNSMIQSLSKQSLSELPTA